MRADPAASTRVRELLPPAANPEHPEEVDVSRPSDALAARAPADDALTGAVPRPRRGRAARRRDRHRQHDGHLGPRAPLGDRAAPGAGRHPRPHPRAVPRRVAAAGRGRRRWRASRSARSSPAATRARAAGRRSCRRGPWPAASARRWPSARLAGSTRPAGRRGCRRPRRCGGRERGSCPPGEGGEGRGGAWTRKVGKARLRGITTGNRERSQAVRPRAAASDPADPPRCCSKCCTPPPA